VGLRDRSSIPFLEETILLKTWEIRGRIVLNNTYLEKLALYSIFATGTGGSDWGGDYHLTENLNQESFLNGGVQ